MALVFRWGMAKRILVFQSVACFPYYRVRVALKMHNLASILQPEEGEMSQVTDQIMHVIIRKPGCILEELVFECPGLTWNQIFCELDRMSRTGQIRLTAKGLGVYALTSTTGSPVDGRKW
jgi:hypothetical protein